MSSAPSLLTQIRNLVNQTKGTIIHDFQTTSFVNQVAHETTHSFDLEYPSFDEAMKFVLQAIAILGGKLIEGTAKWQPSGSGKVFIQFLTT